MGAPVSTRSLIGSSLFCYSFQALKVLRTSDFAPFVAFIAAPSMSALAELKTVNVSCTLTLDSFHVFYTLSRSLCTLSCVCLCLLLLFTSLYISHLFNTYLVLSSPRDFQLWFLLHCMSFKLMLKSFSLIFLSLFHHIHIPCPHDIVRYGNPTTLLDCFTPLFVCVI